MDKKISKLVSVLIPVYNHEKYIEECLDSIKSQDYSNVEIIIINDGSTDNSDQVIKSWINKNASHRLNIQYFSHENVGITKTLNMLVKLSNGYYIALCASDDVLLVNSLSVRIEFLEKYTNYCAVISDALLIDDNSTLVSHSAMTKLYKANFSKIKADIVHELVLRWCVIGPTFLTKKIVYSDIGSYNEDINIEDRDFFLRLLANKNLGFVPMALSKYRVHNKNTSRKSKKSRFNIYREVAISNLNNRNLYSGVKYIFLSTYSLDIILTRKYSLSRYTAIEIFRFIRKLLFGFL